MPINQDKCITPKTHQTFAEARGQEGYTLISMAISLIIVGLLIAAGVQAYAIYVEHKRISTTNERVNNAINQIQIFRQVNNRYPCPSSLTAARNSPAYGAETPTSCTTVIPVGSCVSGVCAVNGEPSRVGVAPIVRVGAIPFRSLQMKEDETYDAYGSRLYYVVTERQAVESTFSETNGGIDVIDENGNTVLNPQGSGNFAIISPGPNKLGAYSIEGTQATPCPDSSIPSSPLESNNCVDISAVPTIILGQSGATAFARIASSFAALAGGVGNFDDTVDYFSSLQEPLWKRTTANNNDIQALMTSGVGVGVSSPTQTLNIAANLSTLSGTGVGPTWNGGLRVSGDNTSGSITASSTSLQATRFCDSNGANCFDPAMITGDNTAGEGMKCTNPGEYMVGVENGAAKCAPVRIYCSNASQPVLTIVNGSPVCVAANANCPSSTVQLCNTSGLAFTRDSDQAQTNPLSIGSGVHNQTTPITDNTAFSFAANKRRGNFKCNNGVWKYDSGIAGFCGSSCTPPAWAGPGPTYSGTTTTTTNPLCAGAMATYGVTHSVTTTYSFSSATCSTGVASTVSTPCNCAGYFPVVLGLPTTGVSGNPPPAQPAPLPGVCGAGYNSGSVSTPYVWNSSDPVCNWQLGAPTNTCTCNPALAGAPPVAGTVACSSLAGHAGESGTATEIWTFDPATSGAHPCQYYKSGYDTSACTCDTTTEHASVTAHASTCNTVCDTETTPAIWVFKYTGGGCTAGPDYVKTAGIPTAKAFKWTAQSIITTISSATKATMPQCNDPCRSSSTTACLPAGTSVPFTSPSVSPGGAACPEMNSSGTCWTTSGGLYYSNSAKCM